MVDLVLFRLCEAIHCPHPDYLPVDFTSDMLVEWTTYWAAQEGEGTIATSETDMEQDLIQAIRTAKGTR